jgi:hypothetical protein
MSNEPKEGNILKLILIVRFACAALDVGHPIHQRGRQDGRQADVKSFRDYAIQQIAKFSHTKYKAAVLADGDSGFDVTGQSALNIPLAVHQLISRAITPFINIPKKVTFSNYRFGLFCERLL